jgi:hypothetical protein
MFASDDFLVWGPTGNGEKKEGGGIKTEERRGTGRFMREETRAKSTINETRVMCMCVCCAVYVGGRGCVYTCRVCVMCVCIYIYIYIYTHTHTHISREEYLLRA